MKLVPDLVSIVTPCYNTADYIGNLLESVYRQTYSAIEMYVIDDGSTEDLYSVVGPYISLFENRGYKLTYIRQENSGQSVAIKNALNFIKGEYFAWPDSDDYYNNDQAIEIMVNSLKNSKSEVGMVRCQGNLIEDNADKTIIGKIGHSVPLCRGRRELFEDCLYAKYGYYFMPVAYMVKTSYLFSVLKGEIYTEKMAGQNWQLMLPVLYNYDCISIPKSLFNVVERKSSHSRISTRRLEDKIITYGSYERTIVSTLGNIIGLSDDQCDKYKDQIQMNYLKAKYKVACIYGNTSYAIKYMRKLKNLGIWRLKDYMKIILCVSQVYPISLSIKRIFK